MNPLVRIIPPFMVRTFANRYVAGDSLAKAIETCASLLDEGRLLSTLDLLAEDIHDRDTAQGNLDTYKRLIETIAADPRFATDNVRPTVSLKLSSYTTAPLDRGGDGAGSREAVTAIAEWAAQHGLRLTLDMESRHWTDFTLDLVNDLHRVGHTHVGTVIQTRLNRSESDLDRLPPGCRVRLVIGIYNEPGEVALTDRNAMKDRMLTFADTLLQRGHVVEFGTHDETYVRRFLDEVITPKNIANDNFEIQMLYGVPREQLLKDLRKRGIACRLYVPFAVGWPMAIAYLRRRLDESPGMMLLVAKNLFAGG